MSAEATKKTKRTEHLDDDVTTPPSAKRIKTEENGSTDTVKKPTTDPSVQAKLEALKRSIAEKKAKLVEQLSEEEKKKREELTRKLEEAKARAATITPKPEPTATIKTEANATIKTEPNLLPSVAPEIDLVSIPKPQSALKVNQRYQQEKEKRQAPVTKAVKVEKPQAPKQVVSSLYDPRMKVEVVRKKRTLNFVEPGTYIKKAEEMRAAAALEASKMTSSTKSTKADIDDPKKRKAKEESSIPQVEWWDRPFLQGNDYSDINENLITNIIDHPILIEPPAEKGDPPPRPLMLTPAERKRLRKLRRAEQQKEKQDRILLGLEEAPKARVRIANMMRVLGAQAVQDPTQIEKKVREEMAAREARHKARNEARKLTPEQRKEKNLKKLMEDTSLETKVAVYRVTDLSDPRHLFKVTKNAQQRMLTGCVVITPKFSVVVVEGGPKNLKKYRNLMLRRIKWHEKLGQESTEEKRNDQKESNEEDSDEEGPATENIDKYCRLVWQGEVLKPSFREFRVHRFETEAQARKHLQEFGVAQYWDMSEKIGEPGVV